MRLVLAFLMVLGMMTAAGTLTPALAADAGGAVVAMQQPGQYEVDINVAEGGGGAWWANPVWIGVGVVALILLVVIVALASRGGGTTVIKE